MKKLLIIPVIVGLVAVPSLALAQRGSDDVKPAAGNAPTSIGSPTLVKTEASEHASQTPAVTGTTPSGNSVQTPITVPADAITADAAKAIAQSAFPDKTVTKVETKQEHGVLVYEVKFSDGTEVKVNALTGEIVSTEVEDESADDSHHGSTNSGTNTTTTSNSGRSANSGHGSSGGDHSGRN